MPYSRHYPATVAEVLDPPVHFRPAVVKAVKRFSRSKPYRGSINDRKQKFLALHNDICVICCKQTVLTFGVIDGSDSGNSFYRPLTDSITLIGKLSIVTYPPARSSTTGFGLHY